MSVQLVFDLLAKAASEGVTWTRHRWRLSETLRDETMASAGARLCGYSRARSPLGTQSRKALPGQRIAVIHAALTACVVAAHGQFGPSRRSSLFAGGAQDDRAAPAATNS